MNTVPVDEFAAQVGPFVEGAANVFVRRFVADTVIDIVQKTQCLTSEICFTLHPHRNEYEIPVADGLEVEMVRSAYVDGWLLHPLTTDELVRRFMPMDWQDSDGLPLYYSFEKKNRFLVAPTPMHHYQVKVVAAINVERGAENIPEVFYTDYLDAVVFGTLARLYRMAGQSFTNHNLAVQYDQRYAAAVDDIHSEAARDFTRRPGRVFYNGWAM